MNNHRFTRSCSPGDADHEGKASVTGRSGTGTQSGIQPELYAEYSAGTPIDFSVAGMVSRFETDRSAAFVDPLTGWFPARTTAAGHGAQWNTAAKVSIQQLLDGTVLVHDRYQNYDAFPGLIHQLCTAHLLRDLADAAETYPDARWPVQVADALRGLIHAANTARDQCLAAVPGGIAGPLVHAFRHGVLLGLGQVPRREGRGQLKHRALLEALRDRRDDILRFTTDLRIPPTSNQAERDARPAKTQQKISGRLRSEETTRHRYAIRGYISTAAKHGADVLSALRDALAGQPWMPPIPDPP